MARGLNEPFFTSFSMRFFAMKSIPLRRFFGAGALALSSCLAMTHAVQAQGGRLPAEPVGFTWGELSLLPEFCRDVQGVLYSVYGNGQDSPRAPYWVGLMGQDFWHMHHYCYGLAAILRSNQVQLTAAQKRALYQRAVNEYGYVIRNSSSTMALMPEVHYKLGEAHLLLDNIGAAQVAFATSRSLRPDYWPSYTRWADVLAGIKQYDQALTLVREGLRHSPDAVELRKRETQYAAAGGRAAPLAKMPAATPSAKAPPAPASTAVPEAALAPPASAAAQNSSVADAPQAPAEAPK
jgi:hypothetical protein